MLRCGIRFACLNDLEGLLTFGNSQRCVHAYEDLGLRWGGSAARGRRATDFVHSPDTQARIASDRFIAVGPLRGTPLFELVPDGSRLSAPHSKKVRTMTVPSWLRELADAVTAQIAPAELLAPLGCHIC